MAKRISWWIKKGLESPFKNKEFIKINTERIRKRQIGETNSDSQGDNGGYKGLHRCIRQN